MTSTAGEPWGPGGWWPALRAALIALHCFAVFAQAFPAPGGGLRRSNWQDPTVQGEFDAWAARLTALGIPYDSPTLQEDAFQFAVGYQAGRERLLAPFQPYYRYAGTHQTWRMFVAPHKYPSKLHIDVLRGTSFEPLYVERSEVHTWRRAALDDDRMRSAIFRMSWPSYKKDWRQFGEWARDRAFEDFPDARAVRLRFEKGRSPSPSEAKAGKIPETRFVLEQVLRR